MTSDQHQAGGSESVDKTCSHGYGAPLHRCEDLGGLLYQPLPYPTWDADHHAGKHDDCSGGSGAGSTVEQIGESLRSDIRVLFAERDQLRAVLEAERLEKHQERVDFAATLEGVVRDLEAARTMAANYKVDAELQSERVTEQRTDLLPQIASLQTDLAQARARITRLERVITGVRSLIRDDHMFPTSDDAAWGVVTHHWDVVIQALVALDAAQEQPGTS